MHSLGLFGSSKLTPQAVVLALVAGLLGFGISVSTQEPAYATACGSGSTSDTYSSTDPSEDGLSTSTAFRISSAADLIRLSAQTKDLARHFIQTANIDLADCVWTPIGFSATTFRGTFTGTYDGQGFQISGLNIVPAVSGTAQGYGLFGAIAGAQIKNLIVRGKIEGRTGWWGGIAGRMETTSTLLRVRSEVNMTHLQNGVTSGGLVGVVDSSSPISISQSSYSGIITRPASVINASGLVGSVGGTTTILDSYVRTTYAGSTATSARRGGLLGAGTPTLMRSYSVAPGAHIGVSHDGVSASSEGSFWDSEVGPTSSRE